ncbi:MAG: hypothetical protein Q7J54_03915 [Candidatus Woesearchaeota archaeon]|nr:hypothetical protein [Candidatus Woesearchaeota archaeon]
MGIKEIKKTLSENLEFIVASAAYVAANTADYILTSQGVAHEPHEGNIVIQQYMKCFGVNDGLLIYKLIVCGNLLVGLKAIDSAYKCQNFPSSL